MRIREHLSPTRPAIIVYPEGASSRFADLEARVNRIAHYWRRTGLREADLLQYSSGTTGRPRGIRRALPHVDLADAPNMLTPLLTALEITAESVYLSPAPLYHIAALASRHAAFRSRW